MCPCRFYDASDNTGRRDHSHVRLDPVTLSLIENDGSIAVRRVTPDDLRCNHRGERLLLKLQQGCQSLCCGNRFTQLALLPAQPFNFFPELLVLLPNPLQCHILFPAISNPSINEGDGFEWNAHDVSNWPIQVLKESLDLTGKQKKSHQQESEADNRQASGTVGRARMSHPHKGS